MEMQRGYNFVPEKAFSGIKVIFVEFCLNPGGKISNRDDSFHFGKELFVTSYLQK